MGHGAWGREVRVDGVGVGKVGWLWGAKAVP
jgi:hypothetical protein